VKVVDAPSGPRGWVEPTALASPPGQDAIAALVNRELPHGVANALTKGGVSIAALEATIAKAQALLESLKAQQAKEEEAKKVETKKPKFT
jgi:hypothetical protein